MRKEDRRGVQAEGSTVPRPVPRAGVPVRLRLLGEGEPPGRDGGGRRERSLEARQGPRHHPARCHPRQAPPDDRPRRPQDPQLLRADRCRESAASGMPSPRLGEAINTRRYDQGDRIIAKGESATTVCEVVRGAAYNEHGRSCSTAASTFGAAGLFENKRRMADIVAGENGTIVAFYDMRELWTSDREKAKELSSEAMEDIFRVLSWLEGHVDALEKQVVATEGGAGREEAAAPRRRGVGEEQPRRSRRRSPRSAGEVGATPCTAPTSGS
ncbi:MAG: hypothetical protein MZV70_37370 [Desulfobacterales bacterium]|nr:hypothetical protein [Desulfobacterales bacterium]